MSRVHSTRQTASLVVCFVLCTNICLCMKEFSAEEGKEFTLTCSGNSTKRLKHIWWTCNTTVLSTCFNGNERCNNKYANQFTAANSNKFQKYTSKLKIHEVSSHHRDQIFQCLDDSSVQSVASQSFLLRSYHLPEFPVCTTEELSRGRIKVACHTSKVYPNIICDISQEFWNTTEASIDDGSGSKSVVTTDILYNIRPFSNGTAIYNTASCSTIICTKLAGTYRFKVKMYPNITNTLVTSVDGYTDFVKIQMSGQDCEVGMQTDKISDGDKSEVAVKAAVKAEPLTADENTNYEGRQTINSEVAISQLEHICENDKDIVRRQLIVILILTCLLLCSFLFNMLPLVKGMCKGAKRSSTAHV